MHRHTLIAFAFTIVALGATARASAQATAQQCPPGQPCVVVVPQTPPAQVVTPPPQGYVVAQPPGYGAQPQYVVAQPVQQRPMVEVRRTRLRWGMIGPGIGLIVGGWVGNWITGIPGTITLAFEDHPGADDYFGWSWIPFIGPFVNAAYFGDSGWTGYLGMHLLFGVLQTAGLVLCILGTALPEETVTMEYALTDDPQGPRLSVMPWADANGGGAVASIAGF
jgi:hypothetical protein